MFALPAQSVWAAAAGYCAHESDPAPFHIGHHVHEHQVASTDAEQPEAAKSPATQTQTQMQTHTDCSYCHAVVAQFAAPRSATAGPPARYCFDSSDSDFLGTGAQDSIERPKWTRAG